MPDPQMLCSGLNHPCDLDLAIYKIQAQPFAQHYTWQWHTNKPKFDCKMFSGTEDVRCTSVLLRIWTLQTNIWLLTVSMIATDSTVHNMLDNHFFYLKNWGFGYSLKAYYSPVNRTGTLKGFSLWPWGQQSKIVTQHSSLWWCTTIPSLVAKGSDLGFISFSF